MTARSRTLKLFYKLHKTRLVVFKGDGLALALTRANINEEFRKNANVADLVKLDELWKFGEDVNRLLRKTVVQCEYDEQTGRYKANMREEMVQDDEIDRKQ
ncbi:Complex III assembly factor LYRM7 [Taenia crassiceps]|uniref:Complex III assembly factor LYRM7 n=1 Tax=Taenia crassiceps TaxID=6207 RepID=A0ABR4QKK5_9CEST